MIFGGLLTGLILIAVRLPLRKIRIY